jgi:NTP pyrophosphatase (non-canonical NTP hydrolase)
MFLDKAASQNTLITNINRKLFKKSMSDITALQKEALAFRDARDWAQFHNAKDLAAGLSIEAGELLECFLWKDAKSADPAKIREELADVLVYALLLAHEAKIDIPSAVRDKLAKNAIKYPVEKAKGRADKYDQL